MTSHRSRINLSFVSGLLVLILAVGLVLISGTNRTSHGSEPVGPQRNGSATPVVLIVLDELPSANLMTRDGKRIDSRRYPNIASFVKGSTWYRDNVAAGDFTAWAVPPIFTGNRADEQTLPTSYVQPNNIFTLLGPARRRHVMEHVTELCPKSLCPNGHQNPDIQEIFADEFIKAKFKPFEPGPVRKWIKGIPAGDGTLSVAHVEAPHQPLRFTPEGKMYRPGPSLAMPTDVSVNHWTVREPAVAFVQQRHLLQTGFADRIVGEIMRKIKKNGDFNRALIVLTADHGVSFDPKDLRRDVTKTNPAATVNPPLIIKYPGQTKGTVSNASTQSLDILPTIAETIGAVIPETDGKPVSQARPDRVMTVSKDVMKSINFTAKDIRKDRKGVLADQYRRLGAKVLWKMGPRNDLFGSRPGNKPVEKKSKATYDSPGGIAQADSSKSAVPSMVSGRLAGIGENRILALAWNGKIVATTRAFAHLGQVRFGFMVPPAVMRKGKNKLTMYVVSSGGALRRVG